MLQIKPIFFVLAFGLSCAKIKTINLREHDFNQQPQNIIWLQVAGLASEHLAMLKFSLPDPGQMISFENHQCLGEMWGFNLFKIRPKASEGFLSQMTGSQNIKGHCLGEQAKPLWNDFQKRGWHTGIIELGANQKNSIVPSQKCHQENPQFYQNTIVWLMHDWPKSFAAPFHFQLSQSFEMGKVYYDKSCKKSSCFSGAFNNIKAIWEKTLAPPESSLFIIRDFRHLEALKRKNILRAREILVELEKIHTYFSKIDKTLIVVSGSGTQNFEFPSQGKSWASFEKKGKNIIYRRSALLSPVYAQGPRSENFCGIFNESEIPKRMLWSPPKRVLW